jgi:oxygen-independent coproporphyrinogen-3 oxidase
MAILFVQIPASTPDGQDGLDLLDREIRLRKADCSQPVTSVLITGGSAPQAAGALADLRAHLDIATGAEITLELHSAPSETALRTWSAAGGNRLSLALPMDPDPVHAEAWLDTAASAVGRAQLARLANLDVQVPLDLAGKDFVAFEHVLSRLSVMTPPHLSLYTEGPMDAETYARAYHRAADILGMERYIFYEPLHTAWAGYACRHLELALSGSVQYGLGPGAAGYDGNRFRWRNLEAPGAYMEAVLDGHLPTEAGEHLSDAEAGGDLFLTQLRLLSGLAWPEVRTAAPEARLRDLRRVADKLCAEGKTVWMDDRLCLTRNGRCWADSVASEFLAVLEN